MHFLIKYIVFYLLLVTELVSKEVDQVIFTINESIYTTIDLENRSKYLNLLNKNTFNGEELLEDYISAVIFNEFAKKNNVKFDEKIIEDYLTKIRKINKKINLEEDIIKKNINLDYQRKIILEKLVSNKLNDQNKNNQILIFDLYNIEIKYFIIDLNFEDKVTKIFNKFKISEIEKIKDILSTEDINYEFYQNEIENIDNLDSRIKEKILNNKKSFYFKNEYLMLGFINKNIKDNLQLKFTLFQISNKNSPKINSDIIKCDNIEKMKLDNNYNIKKFENIEINKLNKQIKNEVNFINDKIKIINKNNESVIILCKIDYDTDILKEDKFNNKINYLAKKVENNFILQKKDEYKFKFYE